MFPMKEKTPSYVHPASYGKTTLAFLLDTIFTVAMIFILYYAFGKPVLLPAQNYQATYDEYTSFIKGCELTQGDSAGTFLAYDESVKDGKAGWERYQEAIIHYYTVFIPGDYGAVFNEDDGVAMGSDGKYDSESISKFVLKKVYKLNEDGTQISENSDPYFILDETTADPYDVRLVDAYKGELDTLKLTNLKNYFANSDDRTGPYYEAVAHLSAQPHFLALQSAIGMKRYVSFLPSFILSPLIFFFIIPLCVPNGRSLGKLIARTAIIGGDGYKAKKLNIAIHCAIIAVVWECLLIPSTMLGIMAMALIFLIDYLSLILSKTHTSLHDKVARTLVIDAKESVWFANEEEEENYVASHPESNVAGLCEEDKGKEPGEEASPLSAHSSTISEETILDSSTIGQARREASTIVSFDEYENRHKDS